MKITREELAAFAAGQSDERLDARIAAMLAEQPAGEAARYFETLRRQAEAAFDGNWDFTFGEDSPGKELRAWLKGQLDQLLVELRGDSPLSFDPTDNRALLNELYTRLGLLVFAGKAADPPWFGSVGQEGGVALASTTFFATAVDVLRGAQQRHAREQAATRPDSAHADTARVSLSSTTTLAASTHNPITVLRQSERWDRLAATNPQVYRLSSLHYFGGREEAEIAELLGVSMEEVEYAIALSEHLLDPQDHSRSI